MAHRIKAVNAYRPRIEQGNTDPLRPLGTSPKYTTVKILFVSKVLLSYLGEAGWGSRATSLVEGTVDHPLRPSGTSPKSDSEIIFVVCKSLIVGFGGGRVGVCRAGRAVKVDGLGTFTPNIDLDGYFAVSFRADPAMNHGLNLPGTFSGTIRNREFIGKTSGELINHWNEEHADDQVTTMD